ncbi:hypothetical protein KC660_02460 [Candidatus Dojkabacteria bacterium]|uniref:Uncharacterized protein n=1 Tax=Candidatus Dojkabacteria bacterium TaxID=2099670 RepID=A0A955L3M6_9BACT|nr:hypothetical protein [Candidatus Dojkabacteria bacterium]
MNIINELAYAYDDFKWQAKTVITNTRVDLHEVAGAWKGLTREAKIKLASVLMATAVGTAVGSVLLTEIANDFLAGQSQPSTVNCIPLPSDTKLTLARVESDGTRYNYLDGLSLDSLNGHAVLLVESESAGQSAVVALGVNSQEGQTSVCVNDISVSGKGIPAALSGGGQ